MTHLLDTNVIIDLTSQRGASVRPKIEAAGIAALAISAISIAELEYGEAKTERSSRSLRTFREFLREVPVLPFDELCAKFYGGIRADLEARGQLIGANDLMIASTAVAHNLVLVTRDVTEFGRVIGLSTEDWSVAE